MKKILIILGMVCLLLAGCAETIQQESTVTTQPLTVSNVSEDSPQEGGAADEYPLPPQLPE